MPTRARISQLPRISLGLILLSVFLATLWLAGGASRADALGQVLVRATAWIVMIVAILFSKRFRPLGGPILLLLAAAIAMALAHLIPLPPAVWQALPGRGMFLEAAAANGQDQPWRPLTISPSATLNALSSLVVPLAMLVLLAGLTERERAWLPGTLLFAVTASTFVGMVQIAGGGIDNPLINDSAREVSGTFANRNHLALFIAMGCLLAPTWAFMDGRRPGWRLLVALGLTALFVLIIVANGSRAGLALGALALGLGLILTRNEIKRELRRAPRWAFPALIAGIVSLIAIFVMISFAADRAVSVSRALGADPAEDARGRGLPTLIAMVEGYFPAGSGLGSFDPAFRIHEPLELLKPTYFNHAHNDWLEVVLDAGLPGLTLLLCGLGWWGYASVRAWLAARDGKVVQARLGSAMLLLVFLASIVDYPARTPMIMAMIVVAGVWLSDRVEGRRGSALPKAGQPL